MASTLLSCNSSWERKLEKMAGKQVYFPEEMYGFRDGTLFRMDMKEMVQDSCGVIMSIYTDVECKTCIIEKVPDIAVKIMDTVDQVPLVLVFPMAIGKEIDTISELCPGAYCIIDYENQFLKGNGFIPEEEFLRTWLVDGSGRIKACGNPAGNDSIKDLYLQALENPE